MRDISIDCEGLGRRFDAPVIAIGAVAFDRDTGKLGATFYQEIDLDSSIRAGRVDGDTLAWWMTQGAKARNVFASDERKLSLATTLLNFTTFCRSVGAGVPRAWGNGATADITWIEYALAMGSVGLGAPWHFTNIRDMRTIIDAADLDLRDIPPVGTAHNALDDAIFQANAISAAWQKIRRAMGLLEMPQKGTKAAVAVQSQDEDDEL